MRRVSLSLKLTAVFILISVATLLQLYFGFSRLIEERLLKVEQEKAHLIVETIEPMLGMNAYLGLQDELITQLEQAVKNPQIVGLTVLLKGQKVWEKRRGAKAEDLKVLSPIKDPVDGHTIGSIELYYASDSFLAAAQEMKHQILWQLGLLAVGLLVFAIFARILLKPLGVIAHVVQSYSPGEKLQFPPLRKESETQAIAGAFTRMVDNVREYTALLERYKLSVDESSIVSRMSPQGAITYVNDEFCRVTGYAREELLNQKCDIVRSMENDAVFTEIWRVLQEKRIWKGTLTNRAKNGENFYVKSTIVPILDEEDEVVEYISIQHDVTQIIQQRELIDQQTTDPLTGLGNRVKLVQEIKRKGGGKLALVNLDNYSVIKDYYGYDTAGKVLVTLAQSLCQKMSGLPVTVFKLASSEYALLCDDSVQMSTFSATCRGVVESLEEEQVHIEEENFLPQLSAGLSGSGEHVLTNASLALKHAQEQRLPAVIFEDTENLIKHHESNLLWTKRIQEALNEDRIAIFVQPIVSVLDGQLARKYECLVRLIEPDGKVISPFFFLEVAKKSRLYHKISQRVIVLAMDALQRLPDVNFSINLSPDDLMNKETVALLRDKLSNPALAERVVLEIVESEEIEQFDEIVTNLARLKSMGCQVAIDDFGTGYSNFAYLMRLDVDYIKVDGSIIRDIDSNPNSQIISRTILDFAQALDLLTVAEFVHNEAVQQRVTEMGFNYLQGYHLGEPVPVASLLSRY